jgi:hypothetical protein
MSTSDWPFADAKNVACFTVRDVMKKRAPVLLVAHEEEDGMWQFLTGDDLPPKEDWMLVALSEVVAVDSSLRDLASLPLGYSASRTTAADEWTRWKSLPSDENT